MKTEATEIQSFNWWYVANTWPRGTLGVQRLEYTRALLAMNRAGPAERSQTRLLIGTYLSPSEPFPRALAWPKMCEPFLKPRSSLQLR